MKTKSKMPLFEQYKDFDAKNPTFWPLFEKLTLELIERGRRRSSAAYIFEEIRYDKKIREEYGSFKVRDAFRSLYARRFIKAHPEHTGFFDTYPKLKAVTEEEIASL